VRAMYPSEHRTVVEYLTGTMGKAPSPSYDPLRFAIDESRKRGLNCMRGLIPYRARHAQRRIPGIGESISKTKPNLAKQYGGSLWLDPGEKGVQDYSLSW